MRRMRLVPDPGPGGGDEILHRDRKQRQLCTGFGIDRMPAPANWRLIGDIVKPGLEIPEIHAKAFGEILEQFARVVAITAKRAENIPRVGFSAPGDMRLKPGEDFRLADHHIFG